MLKLILGRAKSGKTAAVMDAVRERVRSGCGGTVLLIPEQYSHEAETELLRVCGDSLCLYAEVLSFSRLADRVNAELGGSGAPMLDKGGRLLCLLRAVDIVGSRLRVCGGARRQPAMLRQLLQAIDECKTGCISPEALTEFAAQSAGEDALADKLADLSLIYEAYSAIAARSGLDPMDRLTALAERLPRSRYASACYYVDGFTDFTAQESRVLEALLTAGAEVTVCLTAEGLEEGHEIFEPSRRAARRLLRLAEALGVETQVETVPPRGGTGPMEALEQALFSFGNAVYESEGKVRLLCAPDPTAECEAAAARCLELVRTTGCRWRDVAVAARNYETYRSAMESIFPHYGIPLYSARRSDLTEKPLPALILSAYAVVTGGWEQEDVFSYLKTGLAGLDQAECDTLENYAFLWSIHGRMWTKAEDWSLHPEGLGKEETEASRAALVQINALRRRAAGPLAVLAKAGGEARTAAEQARALAAFFEALRLPALLDARARALQAQGMPQTAAEYAQLWELISSALEQCAAILGDAEMNMEDFSRLFGAMLTEYDVGSIPMSLDRVTAGDMDRMRRRHIRHLIVLGCDSESLPRAAGDSGLFTDLDRETLLAAGLELGSTADDRMDREFALIYHCLTLPEESLTLSWNSSAGEGGKAAPSFVVERAARIFGLRYDYPTVDSCRCAAPGPAFELAAAAAGGSAAPLHQAALAYFRSRGQDDALQRLNKAAHQERGRLSRSAVRSLYGDELRLSASRADRLAGCRFSYFLQYGLKAKPRQPAEFDPPEYGSFVHFVLENVARDVSENGGFSAAEEAELHALCDKYVDQYIREKLNDFRERTPRFVYLFRRLTRDVRAIVCDMAAELAKGDFVPLDFELNFGDKGEFPPIRLGEGEDSLQLIGIADRVDGYVHDGKLYVRVVDYKTGSKKFSLSDVWYGMGLQMLLYLFALERSGAERYGREIVPAGVLYIPARDVLTTVRPEATAEEIVAEKLKAHKRSGLLLEDKEILQAMERDLGSCYLPVRFKNDGNPYADSAKSLATAEHLGKLSRHMDGLLRQMAGELRSGSVTADPWFRDVTHSACAHCDYAAACHLDMQNDPIRYLTQLNPEQVWEKLDAEAAEQEEL